MQQFRTYQLALELYQDVELCLKAGTIKGAKRDQLDRAALSISLNLIEGDSRPTQKERKRFFFIALGSLRETQLLLKLCKCKELEGKADKLGAHLYKLCRAL